MTIGIYIHGLGGSVKNSTKAKELEPLFTEVFIPDYPNKMSDAIPFLKGYVGYVQKMHNEPVVVIGSSLGGYLANIVARHYEIPVILINPLTDPDAMRQFPDSFTEEDIDVLKANTPPDYVRGGLMLLVDSNDEILDPNVALDKYSSQGVCISYVNGSHRFEHMKEAIPHIGEFVETVI